MSVKPQFPMKLGMKGYYHVSVVRNAGMDNEYVEDFGNHKNKIVNQGLDWWGNVASGFATSWQGIAVGTGNATPSATDTALAAGLAYHAVTGSPAFSSAVTSAPYSMTYSVTTTFGVGAVVGNIAELGMVIASSPSATAAIFSRALIQVGGSPGTITLTSIDQLVVVYFLQVTFAAETSGSFTLTTDGTPTTINWQCIPIRLANGNSMNPGQKITDVYDGFSYVSFLQNSAAFLPVTTANEQNNAIHPVVQAYTVGAYNLNFIATVGTGSAWTFQLASLATSLFAFQFLLSVPITKSSTQALTITFNMTWADVS